MSAKYPKWVIGIDEVGRGPLAGPVAVGVFAVRPEIASVLLRGIKDSKQLSRTNREKWYLKLRKSTDNQKECRYAVSYVSAGTIDKIGIVPAIHRALSASIKKLHLKPRACRVFLDGGLRAPRDYKEQRTIIGGDAKIPVIAAASILAKIERDRRMMRLSKKYPHYGFDHNAGYGTREHIRAILKWGITRAHRTSFC